MNIAKFTMIVVMILSWALIACGEKEEDSSQSTGQSIILPDGTIQIDTAASEVVWNASMVGMYTHTGNVNLNSGSVTVKDGKITGGKFVVDLNTISPTDENFDPEEDKTRIRLVNHLKSEAFFNVAEYPTAIFEITGSEKDTVQGNLTIRGITHFEKVGNVRIAEQNGKAVISGKLTFDRKKYEVSFKHPMQEMVISDEVTLDVKLVADN